MWCTPPTLNCLLKSSAFNCVSLFFLGYLTNTRATHKYSSVTGHCLHLYSACRHKHSTHIQTQTLRDFRADAWMSVGLSLGSIVHDTTGCLLCHALGGGVQLLDVSGNAFFSGPPTAPQVNWGGAAYGVVDMHAGVCVARYFFCCCQVQWH